MDEKQMRELKNLLHYHKELLDRAYQTKQYHDMADEAAKIIKVCACIAYGETMGGDKNGLGYG